MTECLAPETARLGLRPIQTDLGEVLVAVFAAEGGRARQAVLPAALAGGR